MYNICRFIFVRWSVIKGGELFKQPGVKFPNGLHIEIAEKQK